MRGYDDDNSWYSGSDDWEDSMTSPQNDYESDTPFSGNWDTETQDDSYVSENNDWYSDTDDGQHTENLDGWYQSEPDDSYSSDHGNWSFQESDDAYSDEDDWFGSGSSGRSSTSASVGSGRSRRRSAKPWLMIAAACVIAVFLFSKLLPADRNHDDNSSLHSGGTYTSAPETFPVPTSADPILPSTDPILPSTDPVLPSTDPVLPSEDTQPPVPETTPPTESHPVVEKTYRYFGRQLSSSQQAIYDKIVEGLKNCDTSIEGIQLKHESELTPIMEAVFQDYAEIFWYRGGYSIWYYDRTTYVEITVEPVYLWTKQECMARKAYVEKESADILARLSNASEYEKVKGVYEFLIDRTIYDTAYMGTTIYDFFYNGRGVCEGYARSAQYLLTQLGVETLYVSGYGGEPGNYESHAWNIVKIDGEYYQLDATWGDPVSADGTQTKNFLYFCLTNEEMIRDHETEWEKYPTCTATKYNYYRYEGNYLEVYDTELIKSWIMDAVFRGVPLSFKAANATVYQQAWDDLIDNGKLFDLMIDTIGSSFGYSYTYSNKMYTLEFTW